MRRAIYAGTFDPLTVGHVSIIKRSLRIFDELIVGVGTNVRKKTLFTAEERIAHINAEFENEPVSAIGFDGLLVDFAKDNDCCAIVRGLRHGADCDYEMPMTHMNFQLAPAIETVFLFTEPGLAHISSSLVKEVAKFDGDITSYVPDAIAVALTARLKEST